jgi:hypothetical protein
MSKVRTLQDIADSYLQFNSKFPNISAIALLNVLLLCLHCNTQMKSKEVYKMNENEKRFFSNLPREIYKQQVNIDLQDTLSDWSKYTDTCFRDKLDNPIVQRLGLFSSNTFCFVTGEMVFNNAIAVTNCQIGCDQLPQGCVFTACRFDSLVVFKDNYYYRKLTFVYDIFQSELRFVENFRKDTAIAFFACKFYDKVNFQHDDKHYYQFQNDDKVNLLTHDSITFMPHRPSTFLSDLVFIDCDFGTILNLSQCFFANGAKLILGRVSLPDTLDLSYTILGDNVDLTKTYRSREGKCLIKLLNTDVKKIKFQYQNFKLYIEDSILRDAASVDLISSTYEGLLNNFKENGFNDSYEKMDIEYKRWQKKNNPILIISDVWWKFGYSKERILLWTFGFILFFSLVNFMCFPILQTVYPVEKLDWSRIQFPRTWRDRFLATFLYTGFIFFKLGIDYKNLNIHRSKFVFLIICEYTVGLVCTGFLVNWIIG